MVTKFSTMEEAINSTKALEGEAGAAEAEAQLGEVNLLAEGAEGRSNMHRAMPSLSA